MVLYNGKLITHFVDFHGKPVNKTIDQYPYSYDMFMLYKAPDAVLTTSHIYSDHLHFQYPNYQEIMQQTLGSTSDDFRQFTSERLEGFLRALLGKPALKLLAVMEGCNISNGYPLWRFTIDC